jgi:hypothetical protein
LEETVNANESLGKFISGLRKDGTLISVWQRVPSPL